MLDQTLEIGGDGDALAYAHRKPDRPAAPTFVFVNALTSGADAWEGQIGPFLRAAGFGTLSYNFRGQAGSPASEETDLTPALVVDDLVRLIGAEAPQRPVLVGLSIGGLFAARAVLRGADAAGLVLLNTLRRIGPRIAWVNDALPVIAATGGLALFRDALLPLLVNPGFLKTAREGALQGDYAPMTADDGLMNLMTHAHRAEWEQPWERLTLPVLNITGLCDRVFLDREVVADLLTRLPDVEAEDWDDTGHLIPSEHPMRLAERLAAFGARIEAAA